MINVREAGSFIPALRAHLTKIYIPAIRAMSSWGELEKAPQGVKASTEFVESLDGFVHFIDGKILKTFYAKSVDHVTLANNIHFVLPL